MRCFAQAGAGIPQKDINQIKIWYCQYYCTGQTYREKYTFKPTDVYIVKTFSLFCYTLANPVRKASCRFEELNIYLAFTFAKAGEACRFVGVTTLTLFLAVFAEEYLQIDFDKATFAVSALLHPSTYLNKILLGSEQGTLQLWNIRSK